jgi:hypothetical protein
MLPHECTTHGIKSLVHLQSCEEAINRTVGEDSCPLALVLIHLVHKKDTTISHAAYTRPYSEQHILLMLPLHSPHCTCSGQHVVAARVSLKVWYTSANTCLLACIWSQYWCWSSLTIVPAFPSWMLTWYAYQHTLHQQIMPSHLGFTLLWCQEKCELSKCNMSSSLCYSEGSTIRTHKKNQN